MNQNVKGVCWSLLWNDRTNHKPFVYIRKRFCKHDHDCL